MQIAKPTIGSTIHTFGRDLDGEKGYGMSPSEEFCCKIDVVQKRTTEIGHFIREEEDLH
jgi:hypothetical protein